VKHLSYPHTCPGCQADLVSTPEKHLSYPASLCRYRVIAVTPWERGGGLLWMCPDCSHTWRISTQEVAPGPAEKKCDETSGNWYFYA
jgi:hypothetical protein